MDDLLYIQRLLDRFEAAETSEEEERLLTDYFASHDDVPAAWTAYAVMFRGFHAKAFTKARQEETPTSAATPLPQRKPGCPADGKTHRPLLWTMVSVATAAVVAGLFLMLTYTAPTEVTSGHDFAMANNETAAAEGKLELEPTETNARASQAQKDALANTPTSDAGGRADKPSEDMPRSHEPVANETAADAQPNVPETPTGSAIEDAVINALIQQAEAERQAVNQVIDDILYEIDLSTKPTICAL